MMSAFARPAALVAGALALIGCDKSRDVDEPADQADIAAESPEESPPAESSPKKQAGRAERDADAPQQPTSEQSPPIAEKPDSPSPTPAASQPVPAQPSEPVLAENKSRGRPSTSFPAIGASSPAARACQADRDCVVSCYRDGRCCKELCGCSQVYNKEFAARLAGAVASRCSPDVTCPVARCAGMKGGKAVCEEGVCVLGSKRKPRP